ncbi:hypothetical protein IPJ72_04560 [Candidatus Peregrinibacteria bacterium]|nr:MAG: hypothetical protein IPJ72_04560 [Candidatus Peregrinibacteria bacterium]
MQSTELPAELLTSIGSESQDFSVKTSRAYPLKKSLFLLLFGGAWMAFVSVFFGIFLGPLLAGETVHFTVNEVPTVASLENLKPAFPLLIIMGIFALVGIAMLGWGIFMALKKGGYFVGTPTRLIHYQRGKIRSIDWEQFSGDVEVSGDAQKGSISMPMRTGRMVSQKTPLLVMCRITFISPRYQTLLKLSKSAENVSKKTTQRLRLNNRIINKIP